MGIQFLPVLVIHGCQVFVVVGRVRTVPLLACECGYMPHFTHSWRFLSVPFSRSVLGNRCDLGH